MFSRALKPTVASACRRLSDRIAEQRATPHALACFRIGVAGVLLIQTSSLIGYLNQLFGRYGLVEWTVVGDRLMAELPQMLWVERTITAIGLPASATIPIVFALYLPALFCLLIGYRTRLAAGVSLLSHTALLVSSHWSMYGVDQFAQIALFYCLVLPTGHAWSVDAASDQSLSAPSFGAWVGLRMLQFHVCFAYVASGIEKGTGEQWWTGEAVWRAMMSVHDPWFDYSFVATTPGLAITVCWITLLLEAGSFLFIWRPLPRKLWLIGIVGMHLGIALLLNLWAFSALMITFDIAAYGVPTIVSPSTATANIPRRNALSTCVTPTRSQQSSTPPKRNPTLQHH